MLNKLISRYALPSKNLCGNYNVSVLVVDKLKKSSSGGTDAALIALLRSQILGLEQENEELKGKIQVGVNIYCVHYLLEL